MCGQRIAAGLQKRWSAETKPGLKDQLGGTLAQILSSRGTIDEYLAFLRRQLQEGPAEYRARYAATLLDALLGQPWSEKHEDEAFGLLEKLSDADEPAERLVAAVAALHRLTDRMVEARYNSLMQKVEHQEKLSRTELLSKQAENRRLAQTELADRLAKEMKGRETPFASWLNVERLYLEILVGRNLAKAAEECWEILGPRPRTLTDELDAQQVCEAVLHNRCLTMLCNLAARKTAEPALIERLLKYLEAGVALDDDDPCWKLLVYEMLIALDRPQDLQKALESWIAAGDPDNRWRLALGYLLAEQGKLAEAIKLFEAVAAADELGPAEYRALADWYMALDRRQQHDRALVAAYKIMEEGQLSKLLSSQLQPWQRRDAQAAQRVGQGGAAGLGGIVREIELSAELPRASPAVLPGLARLPPAGGSGRRGGGPDRRQGLSVPAGHDGVLGEVRDEATADSIVERLAEVRQRAATPVDRRALDLLEVLVERRAAELINQPGPHADKALAALKRAFQREWSPGEKRLMADLLAGMGTIAQQATGRRAGAPVATLCTKSKKRARSIGCTSACGWPMPSGPTRSAMKPSTCCKSRLDDFQNANGGSSAGGGQRRPETLRLLP